MQQRARELGRTLPAYVIVHCLTGSFAGPGTRTHHSAAECVADLKEHPGGVHVVVHEDGEEALRAAVAAAEVAKPKGYPVILAIDECVHVDGLSPSYLSPAWKRAVALQRHIGLGLLIATQYPAQLHPQVWAQATRLVLYRIDSERAQAALRKDAGLDAATAAKVGQLELERRPGAKRLPGRHFITIER
jgi:hypothetical protein